MRHGRAGVCTPTFTKKCPLTPYPPPPSFWFRARSRVSIVISAGASRHVFLSRVIVIYLVSSREVGTAVATSPTGSGRRRSGCAARLFGKGLTPDLTVHIAAVYHTIVASRSRRNAEDGNSTGGVMCFIPRTTSSRTRTAGWCDTQTSCPEPKMPFSGKFILSPAKFFRVPVEIRDHGSHNTNKYISSEAQQSIQVLARPVLRSDMSWDATCGLILRVWFVAKGCVASLSSTRQAQSE